MDRAPRVVVANELRSYREAIALALGGMRPDAKVFSVEPEDLGPATESIRPNLVVCSALTAAVEAGAPVWVELYPAGGAVSRVSVDGAIRAVEGVQLDDLLALLPPATS